MDYYTAGVSTVCSNFLIQTCTRMLIILSKPYLSQLFLVDLLRVNLSEILQLERNIPLQLLRYARMVDLKRSMYMHVGTT